MLSAADQSLVHRDTRLPGLAKLLDENQFLEALREAAPEAGLVAARRTYIRYKPGMNCLVRYELHNAEGIINVYAKTFQPDAHAKLIKAAQRPFVEGLAGAGRIILKPAPIQVCTFPNDDKLNTLVRLGDPEKKQQLISRIMKHDLASSCEAQVETLQYKPERRYVASLSHNQEPNAAVKFYSSHAYKNAKINAKHVSDWTDNLFPKLIGWSDRHHALAFEWINGITLSEAFESPDFDIQWIQSLAVELSEFHSLRLKGKRQKNNTIHASKLVAQARGIGFLYPAFEQHANRLVSGLTRALESLPDLNCRIHNDFYAKQVLCTDQGIRLVDSDDLIYGHPAADIGLFIAHLERNAISGGLDALQVAPLTQMLLDNYGRDSACDIAGVTGVYTAMGLIQLAHHPYRTCQPGWEKLMEQLLDRAEYYFKQDSGACVPEKSTSRPTTPARIRDRYNAKNDHAMPTLTGAMDQQLIEAFFSVLLNNRHNNTGNIRLSRIQVRKHKPGRRCLIQYTARHQDTAGELQSHVYMGKIRARGLDEKTYQLNRALYKNGFEKNCADGIEVPEPIGCIPELQMWIQRGVQGYDLFPFLTGPDAPAVAKRIAETLYKLHTCEIPVKRKHTLGDEIAILKSQLGKVAHAHEHWRQRIHSILSACGDLANSAPLAYHTGIHRDFYQDQLLLNDKKLYLLDLDMYCTGDPALDIGNFVAHIEEQSLREYGDAKHCKAATDALINHYCQLAGRNLRDSTTLYTTLSFARHIAITQRITSRNRFTNQIIGLCEEKLNLKED